MTTVEYVLENLACADCANKIEHQISKLVEVNSAQINFVTKTLKVKTKGNAAQ